MRAPTIVSPLATAVTPSIVCEKALLVDVVGFVERASRFTCSGARLTYQTRTGRHHEDGTSVVQAMMEVVTVVLVLGRILLARESLLCSWKRMRSRKKLWGGRRRSRDG